MRIWTAAIAALVLCACASSRTNSCPAGNCELIDGGTGDTAPIADAPPDGPPLAGFGEPCTSNAGCDSDLCILVGTSGQCTQTCGDCPGGYNCLGVTGITIEGGVTFVCVPTSTQLCSPCTQDSECTLIGMDKCVTYPDGDRACGQDCSRVACPTGFTCNNVTLGGANYKQCMAASNACDCSATNVGAMQPCNIITPWNVCLGSERCSGATGWGTCQPPSTTDDPDDSYADSNCDGIDGDVAAGLFVASGGSNSISCGLTYTSPCQTIAWGISRAGSTGRKQVYVQSGTYAGPLTMASGISVFGGYDFNWKRDAYTVAGHTVTISGGNPAVQFLNLSQPTVLDDVVVRGGDATSSGGSAVGVFVSNCQACELHGVSVTSGSGGVGIDGNPGGTGADGDPGGPGTPGCEDSGFACSSCARPAAGPGGASSCGRSGGDGGQPGHATGGGDQGGFGVGGTSGGAGASCGGNRACDGVVGGIGGGGSSGTNGTGGNALGSFGGTTYFPSSGTTANSAGLPGNGGGGGGGGGGGDDNCDSYGSSGGGGGAGGCGGGTGAGGSGGGGSFAVVATDSLVVVTNAQVAAGSGGSGGRGGAGGQGGNGGNGGPGGLYGGGSEQDDGGDGAFGGHGGHGGAGGAGGGGGGGPSVAVVCLGSSASTTSNNASTLTPGNGGLGGTSVAPGQKGAALPSYGCPF